MDARTIGVYLGDPRRSMELSLQLEGSGFQTRVITSSDEFWRFAVQEMVHAVVVEQELQGFLSGLEIVERLSRDLVRPAVILLGDLTPEQQEKARKLSVERVLPTAASSSDLATAIRTLPLAAGARTSGIPLPARELVRTASHVQPLPQLLLKLCGHLQGDSGTAEEVAADIELDARATAELLRLTNSSALGRSYRTANVIEAVNFLGVRRTVSLLVSSGMLRAQSEMLGDLAPEMRSWYHYRSVLMGSVAAAFAQRLEQVAANSAYVLGLMQDMGVLLLASRYQDRYVQMVERVRRIGQLRLDLVEQEHFGLTHADISAALLQRWELPSRLIQLVLLHHRPNAERELPESEHRFLRVMRLGEAVANLSDTRSTHRYLALHQILRHYGPEQREPVRQCIKEGIARAVESGKLFHVPLPGIAAIDRLQSDLVRAADQCEAATGVETPEPEELQPAPAAGKAPAGEAAAAATGERIQILAIEDESPIIRLIQLYLADQGFETIGCSGKSEACPLAGTAKLVLCDVHLDGESGIDVVRALRGSGYRGPVIMISGDRMRSTVQDCIEAGINDYLIKPFTRGSLLQKIAKHLPGSAQRAPAIEPATVASRASLPAGPTTPSWSSSPHS